MQSKHHKITIYRCNLSCISSFMYARHKVLNAFFQKLMTWAWFLLYPFDDCDFQVEKLLFCIQFSVEIYQFNGHLHTTVSDNEFVPQFIDRIDIGTVVIEWVQSIFKCRFVVNYLIHFSPFSGVSTRERRFDGVNAWFDCNYFSIEIVHHWFEVSLTIFFLWII